MKAGFDTFPAYFSEKKRERNFSMSSGMNIARVAQINLEIAQESHESEA
jgi:hypothetical protein